MGRGGLIDTGMFLENLLVAARGHGLDTCAQAAFSPFSSLIYPLLAVPANKMLLCGVALGYADHQHPANQLVTERAPLSEWSDFRGFAD
jgi:nitroreductase